MGRQISLDDSYNSLTMLLIILLSLNTQITARSREGCDSFFLEGSSCSNHLCKSHHRKYVRECVPRRTRPCSLPAVRRRDKRRRGVPGRSGQLLERDGPSKSHSLAKTGTFFTSNGRHREPSGANEQRGHIPHLLYHRERRVRKRAARTQHVST